MNGAEMCRWGVNILRYNISNFSGMETNSQHFHLHDDSKSIPEMEALRPTPHYHQLEDIHSHLEQPTLETNIQHKYYEQFKKIYLTSFKLYSQLRKQTKAKENLAHKINSIESQLTALHKTRRHEEESDQPDQGETQRKGNKRTRRTAEQIERKYNCKADYCGRCYGSQGSLQQHIKLKHPQLYKHQEGQSHQF